MRNGSKSLYPPFLTNKPFSYYRSMQIELTEEEAEWLLSVLHLVMQLSRKWDNLQGDQTGVIIQNKIIFERLKHDRF